MDFQSFVPTRLLSFTVWFFGPYMTYLLPQRYHKRGCLQELLSIDKQSNWLNDRLPPTNCWSCRGFSYHCCYGGRLMFLLHFPHLYEEESWKWRWWPIFTSSLIGIIFSYCIFECPIVIDDTTSITPNEASDSGPKDVSIITASSNAM